MGRGSAYDSTMRLQGQKNSSPTEPSHDNANHYGPLQLAVLLVRARSAAVKVFADAVADPKTGKARRKRYESLIRREAKFFGLSDDGPIAEVAERLIGFFEALSGRANGTAERLEKPVDTSPQHAVV